MQNENVKGIERVGKAYPYHIRVPRADGNSRQRRRYRRWVARFGDQGATEAINTRRLLRQYRNAFVMYPPVRQGLLSRFVNTVRFIRSWCRD